MVWHLIWTSYDCNNSVGVIYPADGHWMIHSSFEHISVQIQERWTSRVIMHVHMLKLAAYPFNIFFPGPDSLLCLGSLCSHPFRHNGIHSRKIIKIQFRDCFYNQQPGAPLFFFYYFSNQSRSISFPLSIKDCFPSAVLLMQRSLRPPRVSLLRKTFSSLCSSMHN